MKRRKREGFVRVVTFYNGTKDLHSLQTRRSAVHEGPTDYQGFSGLLGCIVCRLLLAT